MCLWIWQSLFWILTHTFFVFRLAKNHIFWAMVGLGKLNYLHFHSKRPKISHCYLQAHAEIIHRSYLELTIVYSTSISIFTLSFEFSELFYPENPSKGVFEGPLRQKPDIYVQLFVIIQNFSTF